MSIITGELKKILAFKPKARHDSYSDQFHRIFMVKMATVSSVLLGLNWLKDGVDCIIPESTTGFSDKDIRRKFVTQACWIQGFYIYKDLKNALGIFSYYGIPKGLDKNGVYPVIGKNPPELCHVDADDPKCSPMEKTFYLQYQWFPFFMAAVAVLYYLPYVFFKVNNSDMIDLKKDIKAHKVDYKGVVDSYFNRTINPVGKMRRRVFCNILIKCVYIAVNIIAFVGTDSLVNNDFKMYGVEWWKWNKQANHIEQDYTASQMHVNPKNVVLPTFGVCEVLELSRDIKHTLYNKHQFVCEISQNILYQYVLLILWFCFLGGMLVSVIGVLVEIGSILVTHVAFMTMGDQTRKVYDFLTLRECQYLEYIQAKDMNIYGQLVRALKDDKFPLNRNNIGATNMPSAPDKSPNIDSRKSEATGEDNPNKYSNPYAESQKRLHETTT